MYFIRGRDLSSPQLALKQRFRSPLRRKKGGAAQHTDLKARACAARVLPLGIRGWRRGGVIHVLRRGTTMRREDEGEAGSALEEEGGEGGHRSGHHGGGGGVGRRGGGGGSGGGGSGGSGGGSAGGGSGGGGSGGGGRGSGGAIHSRRVSPAGGSISCK